MFKYSKYKKYLQYIVYITILLMVLLSTIPLTKSVYAATAILRPTGAGTYTQCSLVGAATNWEAVDEIVADDGATYVYAYQVNEGITTKYDSYAHEAFVAPYSTINSVTLYWRGWCATSIMQAWSQVTPFLRISGTDYAGSATYMTPSPTEYSKTWYTNPAGGIWTASAVNDAQIGIKLIAASGFGYHAYTYCTQAYLIVDYTPILAPTVTTSTTSNITYSGNRCWADFNGEITATGNADPTIWGFAWGTTCNSTTPASTQPPDTTTYTANYSYYGTKGVGTYSYTSNLTCCTTFCARAYAMNSVGWAWGNEETFVTMCNPDIQTLPAIYVQATTARLNALIVYDGEQTCDVRFCYGTISGSCTDGADCTLGTCNCTTYNSTTPWVENTYDTGSTPYVDISALTTSTTWYFCVQARNDVSCRCGGELSFTTESGVNVPTNLKGIARATEVSLFWVKGTGATYTLIRGKVGGYPSSTLDGTEVYLDTQTSIVWTGLTPGTTYYLIAWGKSGATYSSSNATLMITTLGTPAGTDTMPTPPTPTQFYQSPDYTKMSNIPFYGIINWWADSFEIPYNTLWLICAIIVAVAAGIFTYWKSQKVFLSCIVVAVMTGLASFMELLPLWLIIPPLIIAMASIALGERI